MRVRLLVVTAVAAERDAVAAGLAVAGFTVESGDASGPDATSPDATGADVVSPAGASPGGESPAGASPGVQGGGDAEAGAGPARAKVIAGGVGPAAAAAATAAELAAAGAAYGPAAQGPAGGRPEPYTLVVCAGIGGGFAPAAPVGSTAVADSIVAADLGAQTPEGFASVTDLGFGVGEHRPPAGLARRVAAALDAAYGPVLTVSTVTGTAGRAAELAARHPGAVAEAMEGFGVAEAAVRAGLPVLEIRAVSNAVGPRDRAAWRIGEALAALTTAFGKLPRALEV